MRVPVCVCARACVRAFVFVVGGVGQDSAFERIVSVIVRGRACARLWGVWGHLKVEAQKRSHKKDKRRAGLRRNADRNSDAGEGGATARRQRANARA